MRATSVMWSPGHHAPHVCLRTMTHGGEIPESLRNQVIGMRLANAKFPQIAATLNINLNTVKTIYYRYEETGDCASAPRSGAPKKLTQRDLVHIERHVRHDREQRRQPLGEIILDLNLPVSESTLKRALVHDLGMGHRIERKTPWLSKAQKAARLKFAKEHISWGLEEWRCVLFTDEMSMQMGPNQGKIYVWRYPEEEYLEDCCGATVIPGFEKVKVWGGMRYGELSELVIMPEKEGGGKLNAKEYCEVIMDGELLDFWMRSMENVGYVLVMEDGAPYHRGVATTRRKEYEAMGWIGWGSGTWLSNSPDLNLIENLWHVLRSNIRKRKRQSRNQKEMIQALQEKWKKLNMSVIYALIDNISK